jgi:hypothetical protein
MAATNYRDKRFRKVQGGPISYTTGSWHGETVMGSRHVFVANPLVASTTRVRIDGIRAYGDVNSGATGTSFVITSLQVNTGFCISTVNSIAFATTSSPSLAVWWSLLNPKA